MPDDDLTHILRSWDWAPGPTPVRKITCGDGREVIQIRIPLGVLQLETTGRPDGARCGEFESQFDADFERLERYLRETGSSDGFVLSSEECRTLREEAALYHHRYVAFFMIEDFEGVARDAERNLRVMEFCRDHGANEEDRHSADQFRPYVLMMRARALANLSINRNEPHLALRHIDEGISEISATLVELGAGDQIEHSNELALLRGMRETLVPQLPGSQRAELEERLRAAAAAENYELAAILRDELRQLRP